jgi:hypothetical protein
VPSVLPLKVMLSLKVWVNHVLVMLFSVVKVLPIPVPGNWPLPKGDGRAGVEDTG